MCSEPALHHQVLEPEGAGPWLVFLHGYLGMGRNLASLARRLAERRPGLRCVLVDLPGHGRSPRPGPGGMETLAGPVWRLVDCLVGEGPSGPVEGGLRPPHEWLPERQSGFAAGGQPVGPSGPVEVIGHSLGGRVAMAMDRMRPGRLAAVTVLDVSPGAGRGGDGVREVAEVLAAAPASAESRGEMREWLTGRGLSRPMADWLLMNLERAPGGGYAWRVDRQGLVDRRDDWLGDDLWPAVEAAESRVRRFVLGGASGFVTPEEVTRLEAAGARVEVLEGAGHFLHAEQPEALAELLVG